MRQDRTRTDNISVVFHATFLYISQSRKKIFSKQTVTFRQGSKNCRNFRLCSTRRIQKTQKTSRVLNLNACCVTFFLSCTVLPIFLLRCCHKNDETKAYAGKLSAASGLNGFCKHWHVPRCSCLLSDNGYCFILRLFNDALSPAAS